MKLFNPIITTVVTLFILAWALPTVAYGDWITLIIAAVVLAFLQKIIRPILNILLLPVNIVTLGFFSLVINVGLLWLATYLVPGFSIEAMTLFGVQFNQFFSLLVVSFLISFLQSVVGFVL